MANITIRNLPESVLNKIRVLSEIDRRSINNELLVLIENGLDMETQRKDRDISIISKESQLKIWQDLIGKWEDERSKEEIIRDIYAHRTTGREVTI